MKWRLPLLICAALECSPNHIQASGSNVLTGRGSYYYPDSSCLPTIYYYRSNSAAIREPRRPTTQEPPLASPRSARPASRSDFAQPTAAPPSAALANSPTAPVQPAPGPRPPAVTESRNYYDAYAVARRDPIPPMGDQCSATFWNLTKSPVVLRIDGKDYRLDPGKSADIQVGRQFIWKLDGRDPQIENIARGEWAMEIAIRR